MDPDSQGESLHRCPECGTYYLYSYEIECDVTSVSEFFDLRRLRPGEALARLSGRAKQELEAALPRLLAQLHAELHHPDAGVRGEAAWTLSSECLARGELEPFCRLLDVPDEVVRLQALRAFAGSELASPADNTVPGLQALMTAQGVQHRLDLSPLEPRLRALLEGTGAELRVHAASLLAMHLMRQGRRKEIAAMLGGADRGLAQAALGAIDAAGRAGTDVAALLPNVLPMLASSDDSTRERALWIVARAGLNGAQAARTLRFAADLLQSQQPELRDAAASVLLDAATAGLDISGAVERLSLLFSDEAAGWHALRAVSTAVRRGLDATGILPRVSRALAAAEFPGDPNDVAQMVRSLDSSTVDLTPLTPGLAARAEHDPAWGVPLLEELAERGVDLSDAIPALRRIADGNGPGYLRQGAGRVLRLQAKRGDPS